MVFRSVKVLIATIGLGLGSAATAEDLVYYGTGPNRTDYYYDADTIRRYSNNTVEVWDKSDHSKDKTKTFRTARSKFRINCSDETLGFIASYEYRANGTLIDSSETKYPEMRSIPPGTAVDRLFRIMCSK